MLLKWLSAAHVVLQGALRQEEFPTLTSGAQGPAPPPDNAAYGRPVPGYDEDERHYLPPGANTAWPA